MRRPGPKYYLSFLFALVFILMCVPPSSLYSKQTYQLGCRAFEGNEQQGAMMFKIIQDLLDVLDDKENLHIKLKWYKTDKKFIRDMKAGKLDFIFSEPELYLKAFETKKYEPFLGVGVFGMNKRANCIYVDKKSKYKKMADLQSADVITYGSIFDYMELRTLINGEPPEFFFNHLDVSSSGMSSFYALAMDEVDAVFVSQATYKMMKATNPGPVKNLRELACSIDWVEAPLFVSKKVPDKVLDTVEDFFKKEPKKKKSDPRLKKYMPMLKKYKIKFVRLSSKDFQPFYDMYRNADKKGWDKDYRQWKKYVVEE